MRDDLCLCDVVASFRGFINLVDDQSRDIVTCRYHDVTLLSHWHLPQGGCVRMLKCQIYDLLCVRPIELNSSACPFLSNWMGEVLLWGRFINFLTLH